MVSNVSQRRRDSFGGLVAFFRIGPMDDTRITPDTWVPLGKVAGLFATAVLVAMWMQSMFSELRALRREFSEFATREQERTNEFRASLRDHEGRIIRLESGK